MFEYNKFKHAAETNKVVIDNITTSENKRTILRLLQSNDRSYTKLKTSNYISDTDSPLELAWLGYFIGNNTRLEEFHFNNSPPIRCGAGLEVFRTGFNSNRSIEKIVFSDQFFFEGKMLSVIDGFLKNNNSLTTFKVEDCELGEEGVRQISLALSNCNKSLKSVIIQHTGGGRWVDIIVGMSVHPQLTQLGFGGMIFGRNECTALAGLIQWTTKDLQLLEICGSDIDDEGVETLTHALAHTDLRKLIITCNGTITMKGWKTVATLLERPDCNIKDLELYRNNLRDEGASFFVDALSSNSSLKTINLDHNGIIGGLPFYKLLCDTSSVNKTYLSNHTLTHVSLKGNTLYTEREAVEYMKLNRENKKNKSRTARIKILDNHSHFDMHPFFQWDIKALPIIINWFSKAAVCTIGYGKKIRVNKLSSIYDFVKEFPSEFIEPLTRREIAQYTALEQQLMGDIAQQAKLQEIQRCKARAMRRLDIRY